MAGELRIPGRPDGTNNPLLVLAEAITTHVAKPLERIAAAADKADARHDYAVAIANIPQHGKVWGTFCTACSAQAEEYVYPCALKPDDPIRPPAFFTIGRALTPRGDGAFIVEEEPAVPGGDELRIVPPTS